MSVGGGTALNNKSEETNPAQRLLNSILGQIQKMNACGVRVDGVEVSTFDYDRIVAYAKNLTEDDLKYYHVRGRPVDQIFGTPIHHNKYGTPGVARLVHICVVDEDAPNEV